MRKTILTILLLTILILTACKQDEPAIEVTDTTAIIVAETEEPIIITDPVIAAEYFIESGNITSDEFNRIYNSFDDEDKSVFTAAVLFQYMDLHGMDDFVTEVLFTKHSATYNEPKTTDTRIIYDQFSNDICGYLKLDFTKLSTVDEHIVYADRTLYMYNIPIGTIGDPINSVNNLPIREDNDVNITYLLTFDGVNLPVTLRNYVTKAEEIINAIEATVDRELIFRDNATNIPQINYDSDEVRKLNSRILIDISPNTDYGGNYQTNIVGDCIGISFYENFSMAPDGLIADYYYNIKENKSITFDDYLWYGLLRQLNSDAFYETYFKDYIDRDYDITREKDQVKIIEDPPPEPYIDDETGVTVVAAPAVIMNPPEVEITLTLNNTPIKLTLYRRWSTFSRDLFHIIIKQPYDYEKYQISEIGNDELISTKYSAAFSAYFYGQEHIYSFDIPQLNSDKPNALRINREITEFLFSEESQIDFTLVEQGRFDYLGNMVFQKNYVYFINDNVLGIILQNFVGLVGSDIFAAYKFIYYDYIDDRQLTIEEYLTHVGYTYDDLLAILNDPLTQKVYSGHEYVYSSSRVFTKDHIKGVYLRNDGAFEVATPNDYSDAPTVYVTTAYTEPDGSKKIAYKPRIDVSAARNRDEEMYTGIAILTDYVETYSGISTNASHPYSICYISDTEIAALGITDTTIELGLPNYFIVTVEISDILTHHSADPNMEYDFISAEIVGTYDNKLVIPYQIGYTVSGTIYYDLLEHTAYFDGHADNPFYTIPESFFAIPPT
jgi:hypothetical protein